MGGVHCRIRFRRGSCTAFVLESALLDFPDYPEGRGAADVVAVTAVAPDGTGPRLDVRESAACRIGYYVPHPG